VVGAIVAILVVAGTSAFAWQRLSGNGTQPHDVLPSSVIAYARVDGDPSASQKVKLLRLLKKSPALAEELDLRDENQDLRMPIIESMLSDCDINYDKDIAPWIGNRFGAGLASNGKTGLLAVQVTDEKAARKGLDLAAGCLGLTDPGVVFTKGYALLGEGQDATDKAAKDADKSPLADKKEFVEDMEDLGDPGIVSIWVEAKGLGEAFASEMGDDAGQQALKDVRSAAAALRAGDDNVEITGINHANKDSGKVTAIDFGKLPADSLAVLSVSVGEDNFDHLWAGLSDGMDTMGSSSNYDHPGNRDDFFSTLKEIEEHTGFVLRDDLKTLLGDNLTIVAGDRNLSTIDQFQGPADV